MAKIKINKSYLFSEDNIKVILQALRYLKVSHNPFTQLGKVLVKEIEDAENNINNQRHE